MSEPIIEYSVVYADDYPGLEGVHHAFFMTAKVPAYDFLYQNDLIESHSAENCLIDHASRLADFEITEEMKLKARRSLWFAMKSAEGKSI